MSTTTIQISRLIRISCFLMFSQLARAQDIHFSNGLKIGEVTDHSAIIWTRLCGQALPNPISHQRRKEVFRHPLGFDEGMDVTAMDGGVVGEDGKIRIQLINGSDTVSSSWRRARKEHDYTVQEYFNHLLPETTYEVHIEGRKKNSLVTETRRSGSFTTARCYEDPQRVLLTTSTCQYFWSFDDPEAGFQTYQQMDSLRPDFFVQTGDFVYYDKPGPLANNLSKARHKWNAMNGWSSISNFTATVPIYMVKDDHDLLANDVNPESGKYGDLSFQDGLHLWRENTPLKSKKPYRTFRWGGDLQIWLLEGREYRSPNADPDSPEKTILGPTQKSWLKKSLKRSDASFKIIFSATPIVGPDRPAKRDNHANFTYKNEGDWLRELLGAESNLFIVCGDRHWQYVSEDPVTGLLEFGSGPVSDFHVQGWRGGTRPEHLYLNLIGGFMSILVDRENGTPFIQFRHHDVKGRVVNEERFEHTRLSIIAQ